MSLLRFLKRKPKEPEFDPHNVDEISRGDWQAVLQRFTEDMDPWAIDIVKLADRYKAYIEKLERFDLDVPGRIILVGAILLRMKAEILRDAAQDRDEGITAEDEEMLMDEFGDMFDFEEEDLAPVDEGQLRIPEAVPKPPVKKRGRRKVTLEELEDALHKAMEIGEKRSQRQETRKEAEDYGIDVDEEDITNRLERLYGRLRGYLTSDDDAVTFSQVIADQDRRETLEEFVHLMHLETDDKVRCRQDEFLGDIRIKVLEKD